MFPDTQLFFNPLDILKRISLALNAPDSIAITPALLDNESNNDCSDVTFSASKTSFGQNDIGTNTVILTVKDASKNINSCEATVTVQAYKEITNSAGNQGVKVWPNPFNNNVNISFDLLKSSQIEVVLYDLQGKRIETIIKTFKLSGSYNIVWNSGSLSKGSYLLEIRSTDGIIGRKNLVKE
jgi:hypothetical protein